MTPILKGFATDDGLIVLKAVPPDPPTHWAWKLAYWATIGGGYLVLVWGAWIGG